MYKKLNSFVYKFVVNCQIFLKTQGVPYKAEAWHVWSQEQYFLKHSFLDICRWAFKSDVISGQRLGLISSFLSNRWLRVVLDGNFSQEYPVNVGVPQGSILDPTLLLLHINDLPDDVICDIAIYADILLSILSVIGHLLCGNNLNWLLNLNLIYKRLWTGVRSGLLISMLGKLIWFHLTSLITMFLLMWKWMGLFLRKKFIVRCWGWPSLLNWIGFFYYLYYSNCLQANWNFNSFDEVSFYWGCSISL